MENLKLHSSGENYHFKAIEDAFRVFKKNLKDRGDLTPIEKKAQLSKAQESFLKEKKQLKNKLF